MGQKYGLDFKTELLYVFFVKNVRRGRLLQFFFSTMILGIFQSHGPTGIAYEYHTDQNFIEKKPPSYITIKENWSHHHQKNQTTLTGHNTWQLQFSDCRWK